MGRTRIFVLMVACNLTGLLSSCATTPPTAAAAGTARITVLYDAFGKDAAMTKDWGFAALVEINGKRILFDTGGDPAIFAKKVKAGGVDLTKLDFVVFSHRHGDHVGGFSHLLKVNPKVKIYAPQDGLGGIFGSDTPSKFYRRDEALPAERRFYGGTPPEIMKLGTVFPDANIQLIDKTGTLHDTYKVDYIAPGHCTGEPTFAALQRTFGDHYLYAGLGTTLDLGASPRAASIRRAVS